MTRSSSTSIASASSSSTLEVREVCEGPGSEGPVVVAGVAAVVFFGLSFEGSSRRGPGFRPRRGRGDATGGLPFVGDV